jgi:hypothetical protein
LESVIGIFHHSRSVVVRLAKWLQGLPVWCVLSHVLNSATVLLNYDFFHNGSHFHSRNEETVVHLPRVPSSAFEVHFQHERWVKWYPINSIFQSLRIFFIADKSHYCSSSEIRRRMVSKTYQMKFHRLCHCFQFFSALILCCGFKNHRTASCRIYEWFISKREHGDRSHHMHFWSR